jgi:hypothetical protein
MPTPLLAIHTCVNVDLIQNAKELIQQNALKREPNDFLSLLERNHQTYKYRVKPEQPYTEISYVAVDMQQKLRQI